MRAREIRSAGARQYEALGEKLTHETGSTGADRCANRELRLTNRTLRQQQTGDVDTGDEEDQAYRIRERRDRLP